MSTFFLLIHIIVAFLIIGLVLVQHGKGAEVGAAFGSGASNTIFGSQGSGSFLAKATVVLAILFVVTSVGLTKLSVSSVKSDFVDVTKIKMDAKKDNEVKKPVVDELPDMPMIDKLKQSNN